MNFFEDTILQARKQGHSVCGDHALCDRTETATMAVVCDGIGSGVYANIAAITCANRLMELVRSGLSLKSAAGRVADSMNRARTEEMPFSAFVALRVLSSGHFTCYAFENPGPIRIRGEVAEVLPQRHIALKHERIAESIGSLAEGDTLILCSDGVTHAGLGGRHIVGWELPGVAREINAYLRRGGVESRLLPRILNAVKALSGRAFQDDATLLSLRSRKANRLTLWTGPPENRADDYRLARLFDEAGGKKAICGSTTSEIAARELSRRVRMLNMDAEIGSPPEYQMEGVDLITEGAVTLNQAMRLLEEKVDLGLRDTAVFKLSRLLEAADSVTFLLGTGTNLGQEHDPLLQQLGVKPRRRVVQELEEILREKGKLVTVKRF